MTACPLNHFPDIEAFPDTNRSFRHCTKKAGPSQVNFLDHTGRNRGAATPLRYLALSEMLEATTDNADRTENQSGRGQPTRFLRTTASTDCLRQSIGNSFIHDALNAPAATTIRGMR